LVKLFDIPDKKHSIRVKSYYSIIHRVNYATYDISKFWVRRGL